MTIKKFTEKNIEGTGINWVGNERNSRWLTRVFEYKGLGFGQTVMYGTTRLDIYYLWVPSKLTYDEWRSTEEWKESKEYSYGVEEIDVEAFKALLDRVIQRRTAA